MGARTHTTGAVTGLAIVAGALAIGQGGWLDGSPPFTGSLASIVSGALTAAAVAQITEAGATGGRATWPSASSPRSRRDRRYALAMGRPARLAQFSRVSRTYSMERTMHIGPRPFPPPFDAGQVGPAPGAFLARFLPMLLSIGTAALIVGGVLLASLLGAQPVSTDGPAIIGP